MQHVKVPQACGRLVNRPAPSPTRFLDLPSSCATLCWPSGPCAREARERGAQVADAQGVHGPDLQQGAVGLAEWQPAAASGSQPQRAPAGAMPQPCRGFDNTHPPALASPACCAPAGAGAEAVPGQPGGNLRLLQQVQADRARTVSRGASQHHQHSAWGVGGGAHAGACCSWCWHDRCCHKSLQPNPPRRQGRHPADARLLQVPAGAGVQARRGLGLPPGKAQQGRDRRRVRHARGAPHACVAASHALLSWQLVMLQLMMVW